MDDKYLVSFDFSYKARMAFAICRPSAQGVIAVIETGFLQLPIFSAMELAYLSGDLR